MGSKEDAKKRPAGAPTTTREARVLPRQHPFLRNLDDQTTYADDESPGYFQAIPPGLGEKPYPRHTHF